MTWIALHTKRVKKQGRILDGKCYCQTGSPFIQDMKARQIIRMSLHPCPHQSQCFSLFMRKDYYINIMKEFCWRVKDVAALVRWREILRKKKKNLKSNPHHEGRTKKWRFKWWSFTPGTSIICFASQVTRIPSFRSIKISWKFKRKNLFSTSWKEQNAKLNIY